MFRRIDLGRQSDKARQLDGNYASIRIDTLMDFHLVFVPEGANEA